MDVLYKGDIQKTPRKIGAESWFDHYHAERYDIFEHSRMLGDTVYTLLSMEDEDMLDEKYG